MKFHRWIGLAVGILLLLQGLSGVSLVFRDTVEPWVHPALTVSPEPAKLPVQRLLDTVKATNPGYKVDRVEFPREPDASVLFKMSGHAGEGKRLVAIDPYRGTITREGGLAAWPFEFAQELHEYLLTGDTGETIIGLEGIALLFMAITGLITWWPGRSRLASGFRVVRGVSAAAFWRSLHRATGASVTILLIFSATTGALMVFKDQLRSVLRLAGPVIAKPSAKVAEQPGASLVSIDEIVAAAQARHGESALRELRFPDAEGRGVSVYLDAPSSARPLATKLFAYNRISGAELGAYIAGELPAGNEIVDWLFPLHTGAAGGTVFKLLLLVSGLSLAMLAGSGLWLWARRRWRGRAQPR